VEFHNLGLGKIKVPFYKKIIREIAKLFRLDIENYVDIYKSKILAEYIDKILQNEDVYAIVCYEINSILVANVVKNRAPKISMAHGCIEVVIGSLSKWQLLEVNKMNAYQVLMPNFIDKAKKYLDTKIVCIPNIVSSVNYSCVAKKQNDKKIIINISRVEPQKQQNIIVEAFAKIMDRDDWEVHFYGTIQDVKYKDEMADFIKCNSLSDKVFFKGVTSEPLKQMQNADIFAFPSVYEGFPLALGEAMSAGLPSIGFENAHGVNILIKNCENGFLCKDINDFTDKLEILMKDKELRNRMGVNACEDIKQYSSDKVWAMWEELFKDLNKVSNKNNSDCSDG
jgi:glycosyltransferase involved in cell wall biosynthesis